MTEVCIIDASVALKWHLNDEEFVYNARELLKDFGDGKIIINVPDLFFIEVGNAFNVAVTRKRLKEEEAFEAFQEILKLEIMGIDSSEFLIPTWEISRSFRGSFYDSLYIAIAKVSGCNFYTGDSKLYNVLKGKLPCVRWIGDYPEYWSRYS